MLRAAIPPPTALALSTRAMLNAPLLVMVWAMMDLSAKPVALWKKIFRADTKAWTLPAVAVPLASALALIWIAPVLLIAWVMLVASLANCASTSVTSAFAVARLREVPPVPWPTMVALATADNI